MFNLLCKHYPWIKIAAMPFIIILFIRIEKKNRLTSTCVKIENVLSGYYLLMAGARVKRISHKQGFRIGLRYLKFISN